MFEQGTVSHFGPAVNVVKDGKRAIVFTSMSPILPSVQTVLEETQVSHLNTYSGPSYLDLSIHVAVGILR